MKQLVSLLIISIGLFSCASDDNKKKEKENPEQKLPEIMPLAYPGSITAAAPAYQPAAGRIPLPTYLNLYQHTASATIFHPPLS